MWKFHDTQAADRVHQIAEELQMNDYYTGGPRWAGVEEAGSICLRTSPYNGDLEVLLIRSTKKPYPWLPPKGHVEAGEDAIECAIRELEEETGLVGYGMYEVGHAEILIDVMRFDICYWAVKVVGAVASKDQGRKFFWCPLNAAYRIIEYPDVRKMILEAASNPYPGLTRKDRF